MQDAGFRRRAQQRRRFLEALGQHAPAEALAAAHLIDKRHRSVEITPIQLETAGVLGRQKLALVELVTHAHQGAGDR